MMEASKDSLGLQATVRSPKRPKLQHHRRPHQQEDDRDRSLDQEEEAVGAGKAGVAASEPGASVSTSLSLALPHSPSQQQKHIKCRLFSTPQGCPFASGCLFSHSPEEEPSAPHVASKATLCAKFFSTAGCPHGSSCRFAHYDPKSAVSGAAAGSTPEGDKSLEGVNALSTVTAPKTMLGEYKSRLCNHFGTLKGCSYGEQCHFAHGEQELRKHEGSNASMAKPPGAKSSNTSNVGNAGSLVPGSRSLVRYQASPSKTSAAAFGRSSKAMINVDANLAGPIIGRRGMHAKQICRLTGAKLCVREHESDLNLRVVEMEGSFEQVKQAGLLLKQVLFQALKKAPHRSRRSKVCKNFPLGKCAFGSRCHFVHAMAEEPATTGI